MQAHEERIMLNSLCSMVHEANRKWWVCLYCHSSLGKLPNGEQCNKCDGTGKASRNIGELLMLVTSELSEALEGHRKDLMDDKLPHRKMFEVELADALIRIFDIGGGLGLDLGGAFVEKDELQ